MPAQTYPNRPAARDAEAEVRAFFQKHIDAALAGLDDAVAACADEHMFRLNLESTQKSSSF